MKSPFTDAELEQIRDNERAPCGGCGCVARLEHDGLMHWYHGEGCPVMARILRATSEDGDR